MSLILDALKKVEREKGAGDPGVVVVGSVPWGEKSDRRRGWVAIGLATAFAALAFGAWWMARAPRRAAPAAAVALEARPTPAATTPPAAPTTPAPAAPAATATLPSLAAPATSGPAPAAGPVGPPPAKVAAPAAAPPPSGAAPAPSDTGPPAAPVVNRPATGWPTLALTAVSVREGQRVALVNDRLVREGDSFDGVRVVRIGEAEVEVEWKGERKVLRF